MPPASVRKFPSSRAAAASVIVREWRFHAQGLSRELWDLYQQIARLERERDALKVKLAAANSEIAVREADALMQAVARWSLDTAKLRVLSRAFRDL